MENWQVKLGDTARSCRETWFPPFLCSLSLASSCREPQRQLATSSYSPNSLQTNALRPQPLLFPTIQCPCSCGTPEPNHRGRESATPESLPSPPRATVNVEPEQRTRRWFPVLYCLPSPWEAPRLIEQIT
ncbi:hypothetical protein L209DRAFT_55662 [Thermothelomyces heterothallicus CBS 203.75]